MKIYTKTGDTGTTMLFGGGRVSKAHIRIDAYGTVDELNAYVGLVRDQNIDQVHKEVLKKIQDTLFTLGANLATNPSKENAKTPDLFEEDVHLLEQEIDRMDEILPQLRHFILPGGHTTVSYCHLARCVCRRTERLVVLLNNHEWVNPLIIRYLNRLSDYLFILGRDLAMTLNVEEVVWNPRQ
jgi:cob(I)alamin adenosyltransferase